MTACVVFGLTENGHDVPTVAARTERDIYYNTMIHLASSMIDDGWDEDDALLDATDILESVMGAGSNKFTVKFDNRGPVTFEIYRSTLN